MVNQNTPWGDLTYSTIPGTGAQYDDAGYQKAMDTYNQQLKDYQANGGSSGPLYGKSGGGGGGSAPVAPNKEDYKLASSGPERWQANINLTPEMQQLLDSQNKNALGINQVAGNQIGQIQNQMNTPFSTDGMQNWQGYQQSIGRTPGLQYGLNFNNAPSLNTDFSQLAKQAQDANYKAQTSMLDPQWQQSDEQLNAQLANQGITQGSEAWKNAMDDQGRNKAWAYNQAQNTAIGAGNAEQQALFNQNLAARQQGVGEATTQGQFYNQAANDAFGQALSRAQFQNQASQLANALRGQQVQEGVATRELPLNEYNALQSSSQVQAPTFGSTPQVGVNPTNTAGNVWQAYNAQAGNYNNGMSGLFGLGSAAMGPLISHFFPAVASDVRLKKDIKKIGKTPGGHNLYEFKYLGSDMPQIGVMAQEVEKVLPEAVVIDAAGFRMVNYGMIH